MTSILIVDDDDDLRLLLRVTLSQAGYDVVGEATDGAEAIECAANLQPDAVILDLTMPGMGGLTALPMLAERVPDTPVIVLTGETDGDLADRVRTLGAFGLLRKPTTIASLSALLDDAVHQIA